MPRTKLRKRPKLKSQKIWTDLEKKWQVPVLDNPQVNKESQVYTALADLQSNLQKLFEASSSLAKGTPFSLNSGDTPGAPAHIITGDELATQMGLVRQKIVEFKVKVDELSKASF